MGEVVGGWGAVGGSRRLIHAVLRCAKWCCVEMLHGLIKELMFVLTSVLGGQTTTNAQISGKRTYREHSVFLTALGEVQISM